MKKQVLLTVIFSFSHFLALNASRPFLSLLASGLGGNALQIGLVCSLYSVIQMMTAFWNGRLIERYGHKLISCIGAVLHIMGILLLVYAENLWIAGAGALISGQSHGMILLSCQSILTGIKESAQRSRAIGIFSFANSAGGFIGPFLGGCFQESYGIGQGFWAAAVIAILAAGLAMVLPDITKDHNRRPPCLEGLLLNKPVMKKIYLSGAIFFATDIITIYLALLGKERGFSISSIGIILSTNGLMQMLVRPFLGTLCRRFGSKKSLHFSLMISGLGFLAISAATRFMSFLFLSMMVGLAVGVMNPLTLLTVSEGVETKARNNALIMRMISNYGGQTVSPLIFSVVASIVGYAPVFVVGGALLLLYTRIVQSMSE